MTYPSTASGNNAIISLPVGVPNQLYAKTAGPVIGVATGGTIQAIPNTSTAQFVNGLGLNNIDSQFSTKTITFNMWYPAN